MVIVYFPSEERMLISCFVGIYSAIPFLCARGDCTFRPFSLPDGPIVVVSNGGPQTIRGNMDKLVLGGSLVSPGHTHT